MKAKNLPFLRSIASVTLALSMVLCAGARTVTQLQIFTTTGEKVTFELAGENPQVKFIDDNLVVNPTDEGSDLSMPVASLSHISYKIIDTTDLPDIELDDIDSASGNFILTLHEGENAVDVYTVDGAQVYHDAPFCATEGEVYTLPASLSKGVYVVKFNNVTYKIQKR